MQAFRLTRAPYATLDGKGALTRSGRWHTKGNPIVYASSSRALALLEYLVNLAPHQLPPDLVFLTIDIPDDLILPLHPPNCWNSHNSPTARQAGDAWLTEASSAVLSVPSVVIPEESNLLINPTHPQAARINLTATASYHTDPRLNPLA